MTLKICDITTFYSIEHPGGVKSYIQAKKAYCLNHTEHAHASIVPSMITGKTVNGKGDLVYEIQSPKLPWNPTYRLLVAYRKIAAALQEFEPDVIEIGCPYNLPWMVRRFYRGKRRPLLVGFYHADFPRADIYPLFARWLQPLAHLAQRLAQRYAVAVYNRLDLTLTSTPMMRARLQQWGIRNVEVAPFGVDTNLFSPLTTPAPSDSITHLLYVGRLSSDKGILNFIDIMHQAIAAGIKVELTIVGNGFQEMKALRLANRVPYIRFLPSVTSRPELAMLYSSHDLLIVPNPNETFCLSALEAMACGTPVAALNGFGGIESLIDQRNGFLLGRNISAFLPFFRSTTRLKLLSMREATRQSVLERFESRQRFQHLFQIYADKLSHQQPLRIAL